MSENFGSGIFTSQLTFTLLPRCGGYQELIISSKLIKFNVYIQVQTKVSDE